MQPDNFTVFSTGVASIVLEPAVPVAGAPLVVRLNGAGLSAALRFAFVGADVRCEALVLRGGALDIRHIVGDNGIGL